MKTKRTTAVQWLFQELNKEVEMSEITKELFKQAAEYERELLEDAYMANRQGLEENEAEQYYLTTFYY